MRRLRYWLMQPYYFFQRGRRGWSDDDLYNLDTHLFKILAQALPRFRQRTLGYPCLCPEPDCYKKCACANLWDSELIRGAALFVRLVANDFGGDDWYEQEKQVKEDSMEWLQKWMGWLWI